MHTLLALHITLLTLRDTAQTRVTSRLRQLRDAPGMADLTADPAADREAGLSTLEITIITLGLFLLAGVAVLAITTATNNRLNRIQ